MGKETAESVSFRAGKESRRVIDAAGAMLERKVRSRERKTGW